MVSTDVRSRMVVEKTLLRGRSQSHVVAVVLAAIAAVGAFTFVGIYAAAGFVLSRLDTLFSAGSIVKCWAFGRLAMQARRHYATEDVSGAMLLLGFVAFTLRCVVALSQFAPALLSSGGQSQGTCYVAETAHDGLSHVAEVCALATACLWLRSHRLRQIEARATVTALGAAALLGFFCQKDCVGGATGLQASLGVDFLHCWFEWTEAFLLLPQLWLVAKTGRTEKHTADFMACFMLAKILEGVWVATHISELQAAGHASFDAATIFGSNLASIGVTLLIGADYLYNYLKSVSLARLEIAYAKSIPI